MANRAGGSWGAKKILSLNRGSVAYFTPHPPPARTGEGNKENLTQEKKRYMEREEQLSRLWADVVGEMKRLDGGDSFGIDAYISPLELKEDDGSTLVLTYPADTLIDWVELNYEDRIVYAATKVLQAPRKVVFEQREGAVPAPAAEQVEAPAPAAVQPQPKKATYKKKAHVSGLNSSFTFDNFVVGGSNDFAAAAAKACAACLQEMPYNPLFIYGGPGLGKTHLLHAIGNAILENNEKAKVLYLTSEVFANDYIEAISNGSRAITEFRRKYRKADVLLIDDVQFLGRGIKTQEEFFHTFNALFGSGKQIVLSADCPASEITKLEPRLSSRFQQGMTVSVRQPDLEMRTAILRNVCRQWKSELITDEVVNFLARNITSSVRQLVGACVRLITFASFSQRRPSVQEARQYISDILRDDKGGKVTVEDIQKLIAGEFDLRLSELTGPRRTASVVQPRQVAMYLARKFTGKSLQDIGAAFGGRSHATVLNAARKVEADMRHNEELASLVKKMSAELA